MYCVNKLTVFKHNPKDGQFKKIIRHYSTPEIRERWIQEYKKVGRKNGLKLTFVKETIYVDQ